METSLDNFPMTLTSFILHHHHAFISQFHWVNGKEGQKRLQEDGWIPKCSGQSIASTAWHTYHGRPTIPSWDPPWTSSTRFSSFKTIQEGQYSSDPPETCWAARETERTVQQSPSSQRSASPEGERTSPVLPKQASHRPHQVDNRYCDWNTRMWTILHDPRCQWQTLQKEPSSFKAYLSRRHLLSRPSSEERGKTAQRQFLSRPLWFFQDHSGQISVIQQQSELHQWWSRLYGHPVHDVWRPRDMSNTPSITSNITP